MGRVSVEEWLAPASDTIARAYRPNSHLDILG